MPGLIEQLNELVPGGMDADGAQCIDCGKAIKPAYVRCWTCNGKYQGYTGQCAKQGCGRNTGHGHKYCVRHKHLNHKEPDDA